MTPEEREVAKQREIIAGLKSLELVNIRSQLTYFGIGFLIGTCLLAMRCKIFLYRFSFENKK